MKHKNSRMLGMYLALALAGCFLTIAAWAGGFSRTVGQSQARKPLSLASKTNSLTVTKAELEANGRTVRYAVKNTTDKYIDWFRLNMGPGSDVEVDFAYADEPFLAPNESYEDSYPIDSKSDKVEITIVSVVFEDKTSDGDVRSAQKLIDKRCGQQIELRRLLPMLNQAINAPSKEQRDTLIGSLESRIRANSVDRALPEATQEGITVARERVLDQFTHARISGDEEALRRIAARYEKISLKLKKYAL
jgi:hypothetical protein